MNCIIQTDGLMKVYSHSLICAIFHYFVSFDDNTVFSAMFPLSITIFNAVDDIFNSK